ncbi:Major facilitator superfamily [Kalmanozyma brasiliensis GHG001]|uniref:Major facilitator superfamily n=1 Tax=Kalmanozyma brasiliensis (strain GHG001) TaxID=1365824 RepID=UPI0028682FD3|nr:Major facilitator superfamily [Kalmanozyma brasiliensis GHG001]KAF6767389.1 Major facilitator superfamily [Kalmanozyma brasiliensis GHG001]
MSRTRPSTDVGVAQQHSEESPSSEKSTRSPPDTAIDTIDNTSAASNATADVVASPLLVLDRGFGAWGTAAGCFLALFASQGYIAAYGPYQAYYESIFPAESPDNISWIGSIMLSAGYLLSIPAAILIDVLGPQTTLAVGSFFVVFGTMMSSLAHSYYQVLLSHGICTGLGIGIAYLPTVSLPNQHFAKYRGVVVSVALGGSSIGGVVWPVVFNRMVNHDRVSYAWTQRAIGLIQLACLVPAVLLVRPNVPRTKNQGIKVGPYPFAQAFKSIPVALYCLACALNLAGIYIPNFYVAPLARTLGASPSAAFYLTSVLSGSTVVGRFFFGWASDRVGHSNTLVLTTLISAVLVFAWSSITSMAGLCTWVSFYGLFYGPSISLQTPALVLNVPGEGLEKLKALPTYIAVICTVASLGALGGNPIAGRLLADSTGGQPVRREDYRSMSWFGGSILIVSAALFAYARLSVTRKLKA